MQIQPKKFHLDLTQCGQYDSERHPIKSRAT
jgi:hypothetical protein